MLIFSRLLSFLHRQNDKTYPSLVSFFFLLPNFLVRNEPTSEASASFYFQFKYFTKQISFLFFVSSMIFFLHKLVLVELEPRSTLLYVLVLASLEHRT